jgi:hypothetical protein
VFVRVHTAPGEEAQVDFGNVGQLYDPASGQVRNAYVFVATLCYSRHQYAELVFDQKIATWITLHRRAFESWGGVPRRIVPDNLKAAVLQALIHDPILGEAYRRMAQHYGFVISPTRPRTPQHKGKVESGVGYVKGNALKGRQFASLQEQNAHLLRWETQVADQRLHGTTRKQVGKVFAEVEQPALLPLPPDRFACFHEAVRSVHRDAHVEVAKAYYSVPPEYLGHELWVRWDGRMVRIFNRQMDVIAVHVQRQPGEFSTLQQHLARQKISQVEKGVAWMLQKASLIGPQAHAWARAMLQERGIEGMRVLMGLLALGKQHPRQEVDRACEVALSHGVFVLRPLRQLIRRRPTAGKQQQFEFAQDHQIIRPLSEYGQFTVW